MKTGSADPCKRIPPNWAALEELRRAAGNSNGLGRRQRGAGAAPSSKCWEARERSKSGVRSLPEGRLRPPG
jgi:hypothetical protein